MPAPAVAIAILSVFASALFFYEKLEQGVSRVHSGVYDVETDYIH
jgi:hypothetical protein